MKKMWKDEGLKFWLIIPIYSLLNNIIVYILTNIWILLWYLFWTNAGLLLIYFGYKSIEKQIEKMRVKFCSICKKEFKKESGNYCKKCDEEMCGDDIYKGNDGLMNRLWWRQALLIIVVVVGIILIIRQALDISHWRKNEFIEKFYQVINKSR